MTDTVEIRGETYNLSDNPSLRTVRRVQSMQMDILLDYLSEDDLREMDSLEDEGQLVQAIIDNEGYEAFQDVMWENSMMVPVQTISLACDQGFDASTFEDMGAKDFKKIRSEAMEALGGDANDFFKELGIGTFMTSKEMQEKAEKVRTGT
jgi:hypothetical protein